MHFLLPGRAKHHFPQQVHTREDLRVRRLGLGRQGTLEEIPQGTLEQFPEIAIYKRAVLCPELCYTTTDGQLVQRDLDLFGLGSGIRKTEFSPDGSLLAVVGSNSNVALYDTATGQRRLIPRP